MTSGENGKTVDDGYFASCFADQVGTTRYRGQCPVVVICQLRSGPPKLGLTYLGRGVLEPHAPFLFFT